MKNDLVNVIKNVWTKEKCQEEALKYNSRSDFRKNSMSSYNKSIKKKWLDEICSHMIVKRNKNGFWTKEKCQEEALKYNSRSDFNKNSISAYSKSWDSNWLDDICSHMLSLGNKYNRCIYSYEFEDNYVYVGLTHNIEKRNKQHMKKGPVFNHIKNTGILPKLIKLTDYLECDKAKIKESEYMIFYKLNGNILLNSAKSGALGGGLGKWSKEKCQVEALKYGSIKEYRNCKSYRAAVRNKWLDDICSHMSRSKKPSGYWIKEKCQEEALKYNTLNKFRINSPGSFLASKNNNWLDDICSHMIITKNKPKGYWTKEKCLEEALKYSKRSLLQKYSISAYQTSINNKWLDEVCSHMSL